MKMAKASQADLDAAIGICSALEAIDRGFMPEGFDTDDGDRADFDIGDARDCRNVLVHLLDLVGNGSIGRVVWGMSVLLDPKNEAMDPDLDYIEHHPKRLEGNKALEQRDELLAALKAAKRAIGDHYAPDDCYATGPLTGDSFLDLVQCPACAFLELHAAVTAKCEAKS